MLSIAFSNNNAFDARGGTEAKQSFLGFLAFSRKVNEFAPPEARYWFDTRSDAVLSDKQRAGLARVFAGQAGIWLYSYRLVSDAFPKTDNPFTGRVEIQDRDTIVALSAECYPPELAAKALDAAGYSILNRSRQTFEFNGTPVCGDRIKVVAKLEPAGRLIEALDLSTVKPSPGADVSFSTGLLKAVTPGCQHCDSVRIPIARQQQAVVVRIKMRVDIGSVGVGVGDSIDLSKLDQEKVLKAQPDQRTVDLRVHNTSGTGVIVVRNQAVYRPSRMTIESIALHEIDLPGR
jgi:hypothetical protein